MNMRKIGLAIVVTLVAIATAVMRAQTPRLTVAISDLHFGPGRTGGAWSPFEDFRWSHALEGFLNEISQRGQDRVDLVIAGDLLELWQHPVVPCQGPDNDHGCTVNEAAQAAKVVVSAHAADLKLLGTFAGRGENHLYIVPGNHDAALLLTPVSSAVLTAIGQDSSRVSLVSSGRWMSRGNRSIVEHGHQIGADPNQFARWPAVSSSVNGMEFLDRPWGEQFVQELFNSVEVTDPLIDNLQPLTEGVKLYSGEIGKRGTAIDLARFIRFNVFQTSLSQKRALGTPPTQAGGRPNWDVQRGRRLGHRLFANALPDDDPMRSLLLTDTSDQWKSTRSSLDALTQSTTEMPDPEILALCDQVALRKAESQTSRDDCSRLGASALQSLVPIDRIIESHLQSLGSTGRYAEIFIYGHTHELRFNWSLRANGRPVAAFNTGAFQRLVDVPTLHTLSDAAHIDYANSLRSVPLENLPACYSAVLVDETAGRLHGQLLNWFMDESQATGAFIDPCDTRCPSAHTESCKNVR
jgi:UDP-2,3-diacylglucosamine pyrophosphatase LpxH